MAKIDMKGKMPSLEVQCLQMEVNHYKYLYKNYQRMFYEANKNTKIANITCLILTVAFWIYFLKRFI